MEPLPAKLATKIQQGLFVELHEFLPKPMIEASKAREDLACTCCYNQLAAQQRTTCSVRDIFTWMICYNWYVAAMATRRPNRVPSMLAAPSFPGATHLQAAPGKEAFTDAFGSLGCGGMWQNKWFQFQWSPTWVGTNVTTKELTSMVLAAIL